MTPSLAHYDEVNYPTSVTVLEEKTREWAFRDSYRWILRNPYANANLLFVYDSSPALEHCPPCSYNYVVCNGIKLQSITNKSYLDQIGRVFNCIQRN